MSKFISFIHSKGVSSINISNFKEKVSTNDEFIETLAELNKLNSDSPGFPVTITFEEYNAYAYMPPKFPVERTGLKYIKQLRNRLLQESDWVMTYDNTQTLANLDDWIQYRQKLRDFFSEPEFKLIVKEPTNMPDMLDMTDMTDMTEMLDMVAMKFPPPMPPVIRK